MPKQKTVVHYVEVTRVYTYRVQVPVNATDEEILAAYLDADPVEVSDETLSMRVVREQVTR